MKQTSWEELLRWHNWVSEHADELEEKYAGYYLAIWNEEIIGVGRDGGEAYRQAEKARPGVNPLIVYIPTEEEGALLV